METKTNEFEFTPKKCEQIDAIVKIPCDPRGVISGRILDCCDKPIKDATLKLLEKTCKGKLVPLTHTFTDENGFFLFGPLCPCTTYVIKIFIDDIKRREFKIDKCKCQRDLDCLEDKHRKDCYYDDEYDYDKEYKKEDKHRKNYDDDNYDKEYKKEDKHCSCKDEKEDKWDWKKESRENRKCRNDKYDYEDFGKYDDEY